MVHVQRPSVQVVLPKGVITSYCIHYTKLYDYALTPEGEAVAAHLRGIADLLEARVNRGEAHRP